MSITFEQALALPQAEYLTLKESRINKYNIVSADMDALVITNPTSLNPIPATTGFSSCMCIMVENVTTGDMALTHLAMHRKEALEQMINLIRESPTEKVQVHMVGACYDHSKKLFMKRQKNGKENCLNGKLK